MKSVNVFAAVAIFASGAAFGLVASNSPIAAQQAETPPAVPAQLPPGDVGRYQITAFGNGTSTWGCYRIDTQTGDTWLSLRGIKFSKITN